MGEIVQKYKTNKKACAFLHFSVFGCSICNIATMTFPPLAAALAALLCMHGVAAVAPHHHHHNSHCLENVWRRKMQKHAELLAGRAQSLATTPGAFRSHTTAYDAFEPTYTCQSEWRTGVLFGDGGKFVCGEPAYFRAKKNCLAYSVGSNGDSTFEADVIKRFGCEVHTFDPTGDTADFNTVVTKTGAHFHPWGIGTTGTKIHNGATGQDNDLFSLFDVMQKLGHGGRHIDILKIDCEGCEYDAFAKLWPHIEDGSASVGQIQVELHGTDFDTIHKFFEGAEAAGYMIFHKERNQWGCGGANCVEYALIHVSEAHKIFEATHCSARK